MTIEQVKKDIAEGQAPRIFYSTANLWWTHLESDLMEATETGTRAIKQAHERMMADDRIPQENKRLEALMRIAERGRSPLPKDPTGAVLYQTEDPMMWVIAAEQKPSHFGRHGLDAFMKAHHQNCNGIFSPSWEASIRVWTKKRSYTVMYERSEKEIVEALFEKHPFEIFNDTISFSVNGKKLNRSEFIYDAPKSKKVDYTDTKGKKSKMNFFFYNVKLNPSKVKVFLQVDSDGVKKVAHEYTYSSDWYSPDLGAWFIYIESPIFSLDLFRNIDFEEMGDEELSKLKNFIKGIINEFFVSINERFKKFTTKLSEDSFNPHKSSKPASETQQFLFQKAAFLVGRPMQLLEKDDKIRGLIYPLIDKALSEGNIQTIFDRILKLDAPTIEKFHNLLQQTELENVVHFASQVATHTEFLDFLYELVYGKDISKVIKERSQLHKIVENQQSP